MLQAPSARITPLKRETLIKEMGTETVGVRDMEKPIQTPMKVHIYKVALKLLFLTLLQASP